MLLSHIEALPVGTKLSVRGLAQELDVSEGTVYKAIKAAELRGLVMTKAKSGTVRIQTEQSMSEPELKLADISRALGAGCAAGKRHLSRSVTKLILCDGDEKQLDAQLEGRDCSQTLCLVGARPDMQLAVLERGANMLITGGAKFTDFLIVKAESAGICVLTTVRSALFSLRLLDSQLTCKLSEDGGASVDGWMQNQSFLYRNDIAADWQRFYIDNLGGLRYYPIVDDELRLCGAIDVKQAFNATDSQRLSSLISPDAPLLRVDADSSVKELARKMIISGSAYAAVMRGERLEGVIFANDVIRFFLYSDGGEHSGSGAALSPLDDMSTEDRLVYEIVFPTAEHGELTAFGLSLALAAAEKHLVRAGCINFKLESSSFFFPAEPDGSDALLLSTALEASGADRYFAEVEIFSDRRSYGKGILVYSTAGA